MNRFRDAVARRAAGTPYVLTPTPTGFDLAIVVVDARWTPPLRVSRLKKTFVHHVAVDGDTYTITGRSTNEDWSFGVPALGVDRFVGREFVHGTVMGRAIDRSGKIAERSRSSEGRGMIVHAARELGLTQRQPAAVWGVLVFMVVVLLLFGAGFLAHALGGSETLA